MTGADSLTLRPESPGDVDAVDAVVTAAFGNDAEARLVRQLRGREGVLSLVALTGSELVGHILFSPIEGRAGGPLFRGTGLAPMAVVPARQKQGIGSALVREGLEECRRRGHGLVVVLGHADYSPVPFSRIPSPALPATHGERPRVGLLLRRSEGDLDQSERVLSPSARRTPRSTRSSTSARRTGLSWIKEGVGSQK